MTVHYLIICDGGQVSEAKAYYETAAEADDVIHSMERGVFDMDEVTFEFIKLEQD